MLVSLVISRRYFCFHAILVGFSIVVLVGALLCICLSLSAGALRETAIWLLGCRLHVGASCLGSLRSLLDRPSIAKVPKAERAGSEKLGRSQGRSWKSVGARVVMLRLYGE
jgi:hypothetical protein